MIRFLFKGLWRDKSRSRVPIAVVATGVMLSEKVTVFRAARECYRFNARHH